MSLLVQFQCLFYSFFFGMIMSGFYHIINRCLYRIPIVLRYLLQIVLGLGFGWIYFYGLVFLNDGVLRFYFLVMIFIGYLFYQKYYACSLLYGLEAFIRIIHRIFSPFLFFFKRISVIIQSKTKRVRSKWRKKDSRQINS